MIPEPVLLRGMFLGNNVLYTLLYNTRRAFAVHLPGKQRFVHTVVQLLPCFCCTFAGETAFCTHSCTTPAVLLLYICPGNNVLYTQLYNTCRAFAVHLHLSRVVQHQVIPDLFTLRLEILFQFHPCESIGTD